MDREQIIDTMHQRARGADSAMVRVLSRTELEWLLEPLLPAVAPSLVEQSA